MRAREPFDLFDNVISRIKKYLPVEAGALLIRDASKKHLEFRATFGSKAEKLKKFRIPAGRGICGEVMKKGMIVMVNDVAKDSRFERSVDHHTGFRTRQVLAVPIRMKHQIVGVLELVNKRRGRFDDLDRRLLVVLSKSLGRFLEKMQVPNV